ncbi:hypothetical protein DUI87_30700 [Hirundo rustica rustica]|uniref:Uncharacterized protein n=1 Tax=Hirundo rustica rustica TaxID=333673 RepID=A0A3M0JDK8_HIRRU|nr:hypothetical protein DUI87_30700 [Hirundo rustica rustica]
MSMAEGSPLALPVEPEDGTVAVNPAIRDNGTTPDKYILLQWPVFSELHQLVAKQGLGSTAIANVLEFLNTEELPLAALSSLKGDIVELNKRLQQTEKERDLLEKKLAKAQCEQSHLMREQEDVQERTTLHYEERITDLHGIIAELNKKISRLQGATIREEDECSELRSELSQSQQEVNKDSHSMDQNSFSVPENQSTMVTADVESLILEKISEFIDSNHDPSTTTMFTIKPHPQVPYPHSF